MNLTQFHILSNLLLFLNSLLNKNKAAGMFIPEEDMFFGDQHRRPNIAFLTFEQLGQTALGKNQVALFIIEIISTNDQINLFAKKMKDYRKAGVQVVWEIRLEVEEIFVYTGKDLKKVKVCRENDLCSAAPILPDFIMSVEDVLKMPEK